MTPDVLEGITLTGDVNTSPEALLSQIAHSIRQGHPQARHEALKGDPIALVGGGPSLEDTLPELRELVFEGAKVVALNGALRWCVERNIRPSAAVVLDAREATARFVEPDVPGCIYYIASQCHPRIWQIVQGRSRVVVWHAVNPEPDRKEDQEHKDAERELLDQFYGSGRWVGVVGGTTVATRAVSLLRISGYTRFHLFGVDSCWMRGEHHAYEQPENQRDSCKRILVAPSRGDVAPREFECAAWHMQQLHDFLQFIRANGHQFMLDVRGGGLLAHVLRAGAEVVMTEKGDR